MPTAATSTTTSEFPGVGSAISISSNWFGAVIAIAFMRQSNHYGNVETSLGSHKNVIVS
jgi:hypothetical protein